jgi:hypothetical protein
VSSPQPSEQPPPRARLTAAQQAAADAENAAVTEDGSALIPALLSVFAAYLAYRTAKGRIVGPISAWMKALKLDALAGGAFLQVVQRALARQRVRDRDANRLLPYAQSSSLVGVDTMMNQLVSVLQFYQRHDANPASTPSDLMRTNPENTGPVRRAERTLPDRSNPPTTLAEMLAVTGRNAAQMNAVLEHDLDTAPVTGKRPALWKNWQSVGDSHVRPSHQFLGATSYKSHSVPIGEPFVSIHGAKMNFPGDVSLGAPLDETINCRCFMTFTRRSTEGPEQSYLPAYWIKKRRGDLPHDEMARREAEMQRWEEDRARREKVYAALFGSPSN